MNPIPNPTRHGNWQVINGELIDVDTGQPYIPRPAETPEQVAMRAEAEAVIASIDAQAPVAPAPSTRKSSKPKE